MKRVVPVLTCAALSLFAAVALAEGTAAAPPAQGTYTTQVVVIHGRAPVPIAAVEVSRALPGVRLHDMQPPASLRIESAVAARPF